MKKSILKNRVICQLLSLKIKRFSMDLFSYLKTCFKVYDWTIYFVFKSTLFFLFG